MGGKLKGDSNSGLGLVGSMVSNTRATSPCNTFLASMNHKKYQMKLLVVSACNVLKATSPCNTYHETQMPQTLELQAPARPSMNHKKYQMKLLRVSACNVLRATSPCNTFHETQMPKAFGFLAIYQKRDCSTPKHTPSM